MSGSEGRKWQTWLSVKWMKRHIGFRPRWCLFSNEQQLHLLLLFWCGWPPGGPKLHTCVFKCTQVQYRNQLRVSSAETISVICTILISRVGIYDAVVNNVVSTHFSEGESKTRLLPRCKQVLSVSSQFEGREWDSPLLQEVLIVAFFYLCTCSASE